MSSGFIVSSAIGNVWQSYPGCAFAVTCCQECQSYCPCQYCPPSHCDSTGMLAVEQPSDALCQNWDFFGQVSLQLGVILDLASETVVSALMQAQRMSRILYQDPFGYLQQIRTPVAGASNELFVCCMVALFFFPAPISGKPLWIIEKVSLHLCCMPFGWTAAALHLRIFFCSS